MGAAVNKGWTARRRVLEKTAAAFAGLGGSPKDMQHAAQMASMWIEAARKGTVPPTFDEISGGYAVALARQLRLLLEAIDAPGSEHGFNNSPGLQLVVALARHYGRDPRMIWELRQKDDPMRRSLESALRQAEGRAGAPKRRGRKRDQCRQMAAYWCALAWAEAKGRPPRRSRSPHGGPLYGPFVKFMAAVFADAGLPKPSERETLGAIAAVRNGRNTGVWRGE